MIEMNQERSQRERGGSTSDNAVHLLTYRAISICCYFSLLQFLIVGVTLDLKHNDIRSVYKIPDITTDLMTR